MPTSRVIIHEEYDPLVREFKERMWRIDAKKIRQDKDGNEIGDEVRKNK